MSAAPGLGVCSLPADQAGVGNDPRSSRQFNRALSFCSPALNAQPSSRARTTTPRANTWRPGCRSSSRSPPSADTSPGCSTAPMRPPTTRPDRSSSRTAGSRTTRAKRAARTVRAAADAAARTAGGADEGVGEDWGRKRSAPSDRLVGLASVQMHSCRACRVSVCVCCLRLSVLRLPAQTTARTCC